MRKLIFILFCISNFTFGGTKKVKTEFVKSFDNIEIAYQVQGDGDIALIFVHGWCCDKSYWKEQISYFIKDYKVVTIDLAGHGESKTGRKDYTIENFGMDVSAVIKKLQLDRSILLGHSLGGAVILECALQNPNKIEAIFPIDSYGNIPNKKSGIELANFKKSNENKFTNNFKGKVYDFVKGMFLPESDSTLVEWVANDMSSNDEFTGQSAFSNLMIYYHTDFADRLKMLFNTPVICFNAGQKPKVEKFKSVLTNYKLVQMEGVGHFLMMESPEVFNSLLKEQLSNL